MTTEARRCTGRVIYALGDPLTQEIRYVGLSTVGWERMRHHLVLARSARFDPHSHQKHLYHWMRSLVRAGCEPEVIVIETGHETDEELGEAERFWIEYLRGIGCRLINHREGGFGGRASDETRRRISAGVRRALERDPGLRQRYGDANRGRRFGDEHRNAISTAVAASMSPTRREQSAAGRRGKRHSLEARAKLSAIAKARVVHPRLGKKHSAESRARMSAAAKARVLRSRG